MGLLDSLERIFIPSKRRKLREDTTHVDLKEIYCKRKDDKYLKRFKTSAVGTEYKNVDGSERQVAIKKLKKGEKVRLIWDAGSSGKKKIVYLVRHGKTQELSLPDCFGRLNDKIAADVIRWLTRDNILASATIYKITGGTRKHPKINCILEITTYSGPK